MLKAFKYRIYPTNEQKIIMGKHFGCCRYIYNWALAKKIEIYATSKKSISRFDLQKELPVLKKTEGTEWLGEVTAQALQYSLEHLDKAYTRFFKEKKGFPKFKSKSHSRLSYSLPQGVSVDFKTHAIKLPKIGDVNVVLSREFDGNIKTVTVSKTPTGKYHVSILVDNEKIKERKLKKVSPKTTIGIDTGVKTLLTCSNGDTFENQAYLKKSADRLNILKRRASKKVNGSINRKKANLKVNRVYEKITNQRNDYLHKITHQLTKENQFSCIVIEDLNIKGMTTSVKPKQDENGKFLLNGKAAKSGLNKSILDAGIGKFYSLLEYKCKWNGINLIKIGRYEPSSKSCSSCGKINGELKLLDREWTCVCGKTHDRDLNAAINIKNMGLHPQQKSGEALSKESVEQRTVVRVMKQKVPVL